MTLAEKQAQLTRELLVFPHGQDRLAHLVGLAQKRPSFTPEQRVDSPLIPGCLAKLWFVARFDQGNCYFECDSDSMVVKAIAGVLCDFYSGQPPPEIVAHDPAFLAPLGITQHLTPNRRNALAKVWDQIQSFAQANLTSPAA